MPGEKMKDTGSRVVREQLRLYETGKFIGRRLKLQRLTKQGIPVTIVWNSQCCDPKKAYEAEILPQLHW